MPPFLGGGEMIKEVRFDGTVFNDPPHKFEAGTPNIAGFVGLGAAVDYLSGARHGRRSRRARRELLAHATEALSEIDGLRIFGTAPRQGGGDLASWSKARTRTTWPRCSTWKASRCAPATTARIR